MKNITILGSTGSIGTQALDVVRNNPQELHVSVIAANSNDELLEKQIEEFSPELAVLSDELAYQRLKSRYKGKSTELLGSVRLTNGIDHSLINSLTSTSSFVCAFAL